MRRWHRRSGKFDRVFSAPDDGLGRRSIIADNVTLELHRTHNHIEEYPMLPPRIDPATVRRRIGVYADPEESMEQRGHVYHELLGFVPPRIEARLNVTGALDPTMLGLQERIREHGMYPKCFDVKTAQLMLFGMLLMDLSDAAQLHGIAARRAGASWEEMQAVINLAFLFRGLPAANRGAEILANIAKREEDAEEAAK
jgi:alkylhydroperoxidase/carboxymuconolactone decarboxylase family protein YurZ